MEADLNKSFVLSDLNYQDRDSATDKRICLVTGWSGEVFERISQFTIPLFQSYARQHKMRFICGDLSGDRPASWNKIPLIVDCLEFSDYVIWLDSDIVIANFKENIIDDIGLEFFQGLVEHHPIGQDVPNCGVWILTPQMLPILASIWREKKYINHGWWEQAGMMEELGYTTRIGSARLQNCTELYGKTVWLDPKWNHHPLDQGRVTNPNFRHITQYHDRLAVVAYYAAISMSQLGLPNVNCFNSKEVGVPIQITIDYDRIEPILDFLINTISKLEIKSDLSLKINSQAGMVDLMNRLPLLKRDVVSRMLARYKSSSSGVAICFGNPGKFFRSRTADYNIGWVVINGGDEFCECADSCNRMDELWVSSQLEIRALTAIGVESSKLRLLPWSIGLGKRDCSAKFSEFLVPKAHFNFISILNNLDCECLSSIVTAFCNEFRRKDSVCLWLAVASSDECLGEDAVGRIISIREIVNRCFVYLLSEGRELPRVELLDKPVNRDEAKILVSSSNGYISAANILIKDSWCIEALLTGQIVLNRLSIFWPGSIIFHSESRGEVKTDLGDDGLVDSAKNNSSPLILSNTRILERSMRSLVDGCEEKNLAKTTGDLVVANSFEQLSIADILVKHLKEIEVKLTTYRKNSADGKIRVNCIRSNSVNKVVVAIEGSFFDLGSLSNVNRALLKALQDDANVTVGGVSKILLPRQELSNREFIEISDRVFRSSSPQTAVTVRHEWPPRWDRPTRGAWVLIQPWEFGAIPAEWVEQIKNVDQVWCPTSYVERLYLNGGVPSKKLKILPNGYDPDIFNLKVAPITIPTRKRFKFLFVGGTIQRKGADLLLYTFLKTFRRSDDVCLVVKDVGVHGAYKGQNYSSQFIEASRDLNCPEIIYVDKDLSSDGMAALYKSCDCLVHPYRGEGFGLPVLEAMACGLPVICTGGGATDDFATDQFVHRLGSRRQSIGQVVGGMKLSGNGWWLDPDLDEMAEAMRDAVNNLAPWKSRALSGAIHVSESWTWKRSSELFGSLATDLIISTAGICE